MALLYAMPTTAEPSSHSLQFIAEGPEGVRQTLDKMIQWAADYASDPRIHSLASGIIAGVPGKDYLGEAAALQDFVKNAVRYTRDILNVESLQSPPATLERMQGDCDDQALLLGSLLVAVGHPVRFVAVAFDGPDLFEHVYAEFKYGTRWIGVETTEDVPMGWKPPWSYPPIIRTVK